MARSTPAARPTESPGRIEEVLVAFAPPAAKPRRADALGATDRIVPQRIRSDPIRCSQVGVDVVGFGDAEVGVECQDLARVVGQRRGRR